jgi:hypothetical protein
MGVKKALAAILTMLFMLLTPVMAFAASGPISISMEQINVKMPQLKVYLNVLDENSQRISNINSEKNYTAKLDGQAINVTSAQSFSKAGEGLATVFLIDISKSIDDDDFDEIKVSIETYINSMGSHDQAAIMTFGEEVSTVQPYTSSKGTLLEKIDGIALTDNKTQFFDGIEKALTIARINDDNLPDRRVICTVTDGSDEYPGGLTRQEVLDDIKTDPIPIYALGIYKGKLTDEKQQALDTLGEFARVSGGIYYQMGDTSFDEVRRSITESVSQTMVLTLDCGDMKADGKTHELYVALESEEAKLDDRVTVLLNNNMNDVIPPSVTDVKAVGNDTIKVWFSESVNGAENTANYLVLDENGLKIVPSSVEYSQDSGYYATLHFDVGLAGEYTLSVSGVQDIADTPNTVVSEDISFVVDGEVPNQPTHYTLYIFIGAIVLLLIILLIILMAVRKKRKSAQPVAPDAQIPKTQPMSTSKPVISPVAASFRKSIRFAVIDKGTPGETIEKRISRSLVIGRAKDCDLSFDDPEMSRRHCEITLEDGQIYANDLNATNTTIINGVPVHQRIRLSSGDVLLIGETELRIIWKD